MNEKFVWILAGAIVLGGLLSGGLYDVSSADNFSFVVNRLTGSVSVCGIAGCN